MVVVSLLLHAEIEPNDHRDDGPYFIKQQMNHVINQVYNNFKTVTINIKIRNKIPPVLCFQQRRGHTASRSGTTQMICSVSSPNLLFAGSLLHVKRN